MLVPVTADGQVILIHEPTAYGDGELTLFLPAGGIEPGEDNARRRQPRIAGGNRLFGGAAGLSRQVRPWVKYLQRRI